MNVKEAVAILGNKDATFGELSQAADTFSKAGLKSLHAMAFSKFKTDTVVPKKVCPWSKPGFKMDINIPCPVCGMIGNIGVNDEDKCVD